MRVRSGFPCKYCNRGPFPTRAASNRHISQSLACRTAQEREYASLWPINANDPGQLEPHDESNTYHANQTFAETLNLATAYEPLSLSENPATDPDAQLPSQTTETIPGVENPAYYSQALPPTLFAGATFGEAATAFDIIRDDQVLRGGEIWGPFETDDEWQLAKWLIKNVGHNQAEEFLKLPMMQRAGLSYTNKSQLYKSVDSLPGGLEWRREELSVTGDLVDADGQAMTEKLEVWFRDPVDCVRELLGNPMFKNLLGYAPERLYHDSEGKTRHIDETWTADWWWDTQMRLPIGATVAPIILSSDKTKLSQFRGDKSAWPIYLTVGNLAKEARRSPSMHGTVLLGYLPVGSFDCFSDRSRSLARYQAFHDSLKIILTSLAAAGTDGVPMTCADRQIRRVHPILAAYVADYPEQCLIAGCMENRCPIGQIAPKERGSHQHCPARDKMETLDLLDAHRNGSLTRELSARFDDLGLRAVYEPFWRDLPFADVFRAFTPDLLHQLHKGVFKDHLVKWCTSLLGDAELDKRYMSMPSLHGLRHFKSGISGVSQWTGHEFKEMEKTFLGLIVGGVDEEVVRAVKALMDFIYLASLQCHTTTTLNALRKSLDDFHTHKNIFIELGARTQPHFNIPKYHMLEHYVQLIIDFGSPDGFNTEWSERLHIDYAKEAYRASNKKDYVVQMTRWLTRQEAIDRHVVFLEWCRLGEYQPSTELAAELSQQHIPLLSPDDGTLTINRTENTTTPGLGFRVAATHPFRLRNISAFDIVTRLGASRFLPALEAFLRSHAGQVVVTQLDCFDLFKQLVVELPSIPEVSDKKRKNIIRASPAVPEAGRRKAELAHCDWALIRTGEANALTDGTALEGLRVARVKVLFKLPKAFGVDMAHPLAYIEWFTPFRTPDAITGLYSVSRSTRMGGPYAEIIESPRSVMDS